MDVIDNNGNVAMSFGGECESESLADFRYISSTANASISKLEAHPTSSGADYCTLYSTIHSRSLASRLFLIGVRSSLPYRFFNSSGSADKL